MWERRYSKGEEWLGGQDKSILQFVQIYLAFQTNKMFSAYGLSVGEEVREKSG